MQTVSYMELLQDKMLVINEYKRIHFKRFIIYIQSILLDFDEPDVIRTEVYISESNDYFNVDMMISLGVFSFVAYRPIEHGVTSSQFKFSHNYLPHEKIINFHSWAQPSLADILTVEEAALYWNIDLRDYMKLCELGLVCSKNIYGHWIVSKYESPRKALDEMLFSINVESSAFHGDELPIRAMFTIDAIHESKTMGELFKLYESFIPSDKKILAKRISNLFDSRRPIFTLAQILNLRLSELKEFRNLGLRGTAKPFWPTNLEQMIVTCLFRIELLLKPLKRHRFLLSHANHSRTFVCIYYIKQMFVFKDLAETT